jgi:RHS repeat-associated protein
VRRRRKTENGTTVWYNYDAAGNVINVEDGTGPEPGASGFYHFPAREYVSGVQRWTTLDPAYYIDGVNLYQYAKSSPINFADPTGLMTGLEIILVGGILLAFLELAIADHYLEGIMLDMLRVTLLDFGIGSTVIKWAFASESGWLIGGAVIGLIVLAFYSGMKLGQWVDDYTAGRIEYFLRIRQEQGFDALITALCGSQECGTEQSYQMCVDTLLMAFGLAYVYGLAGSLSMTPELADVLIDAPWLW